MGLLSLLFLGACSNNKQETASSSSSHVSSSLASTDTINQTLDTVGSLKYHLGTVTTRKVENDRNNYTEAVSHLLGILTIVLQSLIVLLMLAKKLLI